MCSLSGPVSFYLPGDVQRLLQKLFTKDKLFKQACDYLWLWLTANNLPRDMTTKEHCGILKRIVDQDMQ